MSPYGRIKKVLEIIRNFCRSASRKHMGFQDTLNLNLGGSLRIMGCFRKTISKVSVTPGRHLFFYERSPIRKLTLPGLKLFTQIIVNSDRVRFTRTISTHQIFKGFILDLKKEHISREVSQWKSEA
jgi:hypothetical protein